MLVLFHVAEVDTMAEPRGGVEVERHPKGDERQVAEVDRSNEEGGRPQWGGQESHDAMASEAFRDWCFRGARDNRPSERCEKAFCQRTDC